MKTDARLGDQAENLRSILSQIKEVNQNLERLIPGPQRPEKENEKGHPLYNLKICMYWLRKIDFECKLSVEELEVAKHEKYRHFRGF